MKYIFTLIILLVALILADLFFYVFELVYLKFTSKSKITSKEHIEKTHKHFIAAFIDFPEYLGSFILSRLFKEKVEDWHMILTKRKKWGVRSAVAQKLGQLLIFALVLVILIIIASNK